MKIIKFANNNMITDLTYDMLDWLCINGCEYLPRLFMVKYRWHDEVDVEIPKFITIRYFKSLDKKIQKLMLNIVETGIKNN